MEPVACSAGVYVPPVGYLQKLREICDRHGILLIFDEVINAWGRLGKPFAADYFGVIPDLITTAKGITNGTVPMGAVFMKENLYQAFMTGPENAIEMPHGYTYSAHPLACAAGLGTLKVYEDEGLLTRVGELAKYWEDGAHSLQGLPERHRHPQSRPHRRDRTRAACRARSARAGWRRTSRPSRRAPTCASPATPSRSRRR